MVVYNRCMDEKKTDTSKSLDGKDSSKENLRDSLNKRISYLCCLAALVLAVLTFATTIIGQDDMVFIVLGLSLSIALLAIAGLQNYKR